MKNIFLLLAAVLIISCNTSGTNADEGSFDLTGYETFKIKGSDAVHVVKKDANGQTMEEGFLIGGKQIGQWITYDPTKGSIASMDSYIDGVLNGYSFKVSSRGYLDEQIGYINGELHGKYFKYRYGRPKFEAYYEKGVLNGVQTEYYDNGKIQQQTSFKNGVQDGEFKYYSDDGVLRMSYMYKNGKKVSGGMVEAEEPASEK